MSAEAERVKRAIDVVGAAAGLALAAPVLALAACAIKLEDRGPGVLPPDARSAAARSRFEMLKLRTMTSTPTRSAATASSRRATRASRASARCCGAPPIDELPQLWNVLRGEMSLVGPRPVPLPHLERYDERQRRRLEVRPGLTGWAQIHGRASLPWPERIELDVWYVEHRSLALDARILARTAGVLLRRDFVYRGEAGGWR